MSFSLKYFLIKLVGKFQVLCFLIPEAMWKLSWCYFNLSFFNYTFILIHYCPQLYTAWYFGAFRFLFTSLSHLGHLLRYCISQAHLSFSHREIFGLSLPPVCISVQFFCCNHCSSSLSPLSTGRDKALRSWVPHLFYFVLRK